MLPDFPAAKAAFKELFMQRYHCQLRGSGILADLPAPVGFEEGERWAVQREDGTMSEDAFMSHSSQLRFTIEELDSFTSNELLSRWDQAARAMQDSITSQLLKNISQVCEETGNVVDGVGQSFKESFLAMIRAIDWSFEPDGSRSPGMKIYLHPNTLAKIQTELGALESDLVFERQLKDIEETKREEWRAREADRKLVG